MEATIWQTDHVADRHRDPTVTVRPTEEVKTAATKLLAAHGWTLQAYLLACLGELLAEPKRRVAEPKPFRPPEKPTGRPPKRDEVKPEVEPTSAVPPGRRPRRPPPTFAPIEVEESVDELVSEPFEDPA